MNSDQEFGVAIGLGTVSQITHEATQHALVDAGIIQGSCEWKDLPADYRNKFLAFVQSMLRTKQYISVRKVFEEWRAEMEQDGWRYSEQCDAELKTDPRIKSFDKLELCERLMYALVASMAWMVAQVLDSVTIAVRERRQVKGSALH